MEHVHQQGVVRRLHHVTQQQPHRRAPHDLREACQFGKHLFGIWCKNPEINQSFLYHVFAGDGCDDCARAVALRISE